MSPQLRLTSLDDKITGLQEQLDAIEADYQKQKAAIEAKLAKLRAVKFRITPDLEVFIAQLNDALS